jgi:hypothetical protein
MVRRPLRENRVGIHQTIDAEVLARVTGQAHKTIEYLSVCRRWQDVASVQALISHAEISRAIADTAEVEALRWRATANDHALSVMALGEARRILNENGVPQAAFFDDHVANAVVQRNLMGRLVEEVLGKLDANDPELAAFATEIRRRRAELGYVEKDGGAAVAAEQPEGDQEPARGP